jgi:hypothetical protein
MVTPFRLLREVLLLSVLLASVGLAQTPAPFSASPEALLALAAANKPAGDPSVHLLRMEQRLAFDAQGRSVPATTRLWPGLLAAAVLFNLLELVIRKWRSILPEKWQSAISGSQI